VKRRRCSAKMPGAFIIYRSEIRRRLPMMRVNEWCVSGIGNHFPVSRGNRANGLFIIEFFQ
jgi:hypothetical protein